MTGCSIFLLESHALTQAAPLLPSQKGGSGVHTKGRGNGEGLPKYQMIGLTDRTERGG